MTASRGPFSVGIIMDGNRRWATTRGLSPFKGHDAGEEALLNLIDEYRSLRDKWGTAHYVFYAFSTENWTRTQEEIAALLGIFERAFTKIEERLPRLLEDSVAIRFVGEVERFSPKLQELMRGIEEKTKAGKDGTIAIAVSYGGRADILRAVNKLIQEDKEVITENDLSAASWLAGIPEPDLIIRTSGEERLSGFLTWQSVYSELLFVDTLWPDFTRSELEKAFTEFEERERRHGK